MNFEVRAMAIVRLPGTRAPILGLASRCRSIFSVSVYVGGHESIGRVVGGGRNNSVKQKVSCGEYSYQLARIVVKILHRPRGRPAVALDVVMRKERVLLDREARVKNRDAFPHEPRS